MIDTFVRLYEKLTDRPRPSYNVQRINRLVDELRSDTDKLKGLLNSYTETEEPLVNLMTEVFNKKQLTTNGNGKHHEQ